MNDDDNLDLDGAAQTDEDALRLNAEMRVQFDADEMAGFFDAFVPLENPFDPPPRQLPDRRPAIAALDGLDELDAVAA